MRRFELWVPGRVETPNQLWHAHWRERHRSVKATRSKVELLMTRAMHANRVAPFAGAATVTFEMRRVRLLDTQDNANYAVKAIKDGLTIPPPKAKRRVVGKNGKAKDVVVAIGPQPLCALPNGDGPTCGYEFKPVVQLKVKTAADEGVLVVIEGE